jgi:UV DNA damage endonuclease
MNLSLCCISLRLQEQGYKFQTMTYTRFASLPRKEALEILSARILNNFEVTGKIIQYCHSSGIKGYRLSSGLTPVINHPSVNMSISDLPNSDKIFKEINNVKQIIKNTGIRISAHPSEYISLTNTNSNVISNSIRDLEQHGEIFDLLDLPQSHWSPLNIHCRQDGEPDKVFQEFAKNYAKLSDSVKKRLVIEVNDNKNGTWHIPNLIQYFYDKLGLPITFDSLHQKFCHGSLTEEEAFKKAHSTWSETPLFHYSEGVDGTRKHADYATGVPNNYGMEVYWDCELKQKDLAIEKMFSMI